MSNLFGDLNFGQSKHWMDLNSYVFTLKLINVSDPFAAAAIWERSTGGDKGMTDDEYNSDHRLYRALNSHRDELSSRRATNVKKRNPLRRKKYVYSDVVIWIPASFWHKDRIKGFQKLLFMTEIFHDQHWATFSEDEFYRSRPPNYSIMPLKGLKDDEVICQFGVGVFLPNSEDEQTASITLSQQGYDPSELTDWVFFKPTLDDEGEVIDPLQPLKVIRPAGLYADQIMLLISRQLDNSPLQSPLWFDFSKIIEREQEKQEREKDENKQETTETTETTINEGSIIITFNDNQADIDTEGLHIKNIGTQRSKSETRCHFSLVSNPNDVLTLTLDRDGVKNSAMDILRRSSSSMGAGSHTILDDDGGDFAGFTNLGVSDDDQTDYRYELQLTGIVLPKLSAYPSAKRLSHYELYINKEGVPTKHEDDIAWIIKGKKDSDTLVWSTPNDNKPKALKPNDSLPYPTNQSLYLLPPELKKTQYGILSVPEKTIKISLEVDELIIGRYQGEDRTTADFPLALLSQSSALIDINNRKTRTLGDIGLSGNHLKISLKGNKLSLEQVSRSKTYIVQKKGGIRLILGANQRQGDARQGESIILGPFQFKFDLAKD